jgi:DNA (cytosine-5)-methyltransferase 1
MKPTINHGSLFSGLGGFDLAAQKVGWNNVFHCEWEPFPRQILQYYWPQTKSYTDVKETSFKAWRHVPNLVISGGFPCQPFSAAGKRQGTIDGRYLWPEMLRAIRESKPVAVVAENVAGLLTMGEREVFAQVDSRNNIRYTDYDHYEAIYTRQEEMLLKNIIEDLEKEGYSVQTLVIPAAGVGAPHKRERIWIVAYSNERDDRRTTGEDASEGSKERLSERHEIRQSAKSGEVQRNASGPNNRQQKQSEKQLQARRNTFNGGNIGYASDTSSTELQGSIKQGSTKETGATENKSRQSSGSICSQWQKFPTQPPICGGNDGLPSELDGITFSKWRSESLKGYGNAVVPQIPERLFTAIELKIYEDY